MTIQAEGRLSTPPLTFASIDLNPTNASFEPLHLSPWCNKTRPACPPTTTTIHVRPCPSQPGSPCQQTSSPTPGSLHWRVSSESSFSKSTLNPSASEFVPKTNKPKPVHNPLGGKLALVAAGFFERAYGLNGQIRVDHTKLKNEMMTLTGCSERAVQAVLYGSSYSDLLDGLRAKVPGYTVQKDMTQDFTRLPFYEFDGNQVAPATSSATDNKYTYIAALALAAMIPFTFFC